MLVAGSVLRLLLVLMNQDQILQIIHIILYLIRLINWWRRKYSTIENKMKKERKW